ncbi:MAG: DTW domain-containing protein [Chitinispirillales bacterium]|jgi:DTW domain-containing protein YfiP|nr:DTW domain-containing protein [Chitinispirillales bacterium]
MDAKLKFNRNAVCENCFREKQMCICNAAESFSNKIRVLILQHPQEQFKMLNSARLTRLVLQNSELRVGLSWPNFKRACGSDEAPSDWGILYLKNELHLSNENNSAKQNSAMNLTDKKGHIIEEKSHIKGIVVIDGSWKQAKAMWWRNPWFLRLNRISLNPEHPSLRKQVKKSGLSTIEAVSLALSELGENNNICQSLIKQYEELIVKPVSALKQ